MTTRQKLLCLLLLSTFAMPLATEARLGHPTTQASQSVPLPDQVVPQPPAPDKPSPPVEKPPARPEKPTAPRTTKPPAVEVEKPDTPEPSPEDRWEARNRTQPAFRLGTDYSLAAGEEAREVVVISGAASIAGHVHGDVVVILGMADIAGTAVVDGDFVVIGGRAVIQPGAMVARDMVVVGGSLDAPPGFKSGGEQVVVGSETLGLSIQPFVSWVARGPMWGRLIVPDLAWVWWVVGFFFFLYFVLNLLAERPVRACADVVSEKPLTTFLVGLLVLLVTGPMMLILAVSLVGVVVMPFVVCGLLLAGLIGKVGVARWMGRSIVPEGPAEPGTGASRTLAVRSFVIGFAVIVVALAIPVLGIVVWSSLGVLALGAGVSAFIGYYQKENPPKPPRAVAGPSTGAAPVFVPAPPMEPPTFSAETPQEAAPPPLADSGGFPYAPFRDRLAAFLLDVVLVSITAALLTDGGRGPGRVLLLLLVYHIGFWAWKGTTVGGIICQLRVVRTSGQPLTFADALVRGLSSIFSLAVLGIGGLWILKDPERQAWHDKIAGTYVVKVPRHYPI